MMTGVHDLGWWYWFFTGVLLGASLFGWPLGIILAAGLCAIQLGHVVSLTRDVMAFPVQVRTAYLSMLVAGLWEPFHWVHWLQLAGTTARVVIGYCLLARTLSLAPWNRRQPLSPDLITRTFLSIQATVPPCGAVFRQMSLERVQG